MTLDESATAGAEMTGTNSAGGRGRLRSLLRPPTVLAVDCQPLFVSGLAQCVRQRLPWLHWAGSVLLPGPLLAAVGRIGPDLLVINGASVGMATAGSLVRALRAADSALVSTALLLLAPCREALESLRIGDVQGLALVTDGPAELATAIERTLRDKHYRSPMLHGLRSNPPNAATPAVATATRPKLTAREHEVLELISEGLNTDEMAQRLTVGRETVRTHVRALLRKLGAEDRAFAVAKAFRFGLLK